MSSIEGSAAAARSAASRRPRPPSRAPYVRLAFELCRREPSRDVRVQPAKRADRQCVAQYVPERAIATVRARTEPIAVLNPRSPTRNLSGPGTELVLDADVSPQDLAPPAVVVSGDHRYGDPRVDDVGDRGERAKAAPRNDSAPLEPELEQIPVDDERPGMLGDVAKESDDGPLDVIMREAEVRVRDDIAGRVEPRRGGHARILPSSRSLYKRLRADDLREVTNDDGAGASAQVRDHVHHDVEFRVRYAETDQMGVVYHANYLIWCEVGRTDFIRARGMSYADMERAGVGLAVSDVTARFHAAARYDELIRVRTTLADIRSRSITFDYLISSVERGVRLVTARTTLVCIDPSGRPIALPADVRSMFDR